MSQLRFEQALLCAARLATTIVTKSIDGPVIVRDLRGYLRIAIDDRKDPLSPAQQSLLGAELQRQVGVWAGGVVVASDLFDPDAVFKSPELTPIVGTPVRLLDRLVIGIDWLTAPTEGARKSHPPRAVFHGIKGGVGRSTAMAVVAIELARRGHRVLVIDLDLESPGLTHLLLPPDALPAMGLLDAYVEVGVSARLSHQTLRSLYAASSLAGRLGLDGQVLVVPTRGADPGDFLAKLSRAYVTDSQGSGTFAARTLHILEALEAELAPDVVLIDSRAGLHDIAAAAITRLDAQVWLFCGASEQTWQDYGLLFAGWNLRDLAQRFRERLKVVAALVPDTGERQHLDALIGRAHACFSRHLYDEERAEDLESGGAYNFDLEDTEAPHHPVIVRWHRAMFEWDASGAWPAPETAEFVYGALVRDIETVLLGERR